MPGLHRLKGDRTSGGQHPAGHSAGRCIDATGNVDGKHRNVGHLRRLPHTAEAGAVGGIDDQMAIGDGRRCPHCIVHEHAHTPLPQTFSGHTTIGAVVALSGNHDDASTIGSVHQESCRMRNGVCGTSDEYVDIDTAVLVDVAHLRWCEYRLHP